MTGSYRNVKFGYCPLCDDDCYYRVFFDDNGTKGVEYYCGPARELGNVCPLVAVARALGTGGRDD